MLVLGLATQRRLEVAKPCGALIDHHLSMCLDEVQKSLDHCGPNAAEYDSWQLVLGQITHCMELVVKARLTCEGIANRGIFRGDVVLIKRDLQQGIISRSQMCGQLGKVSQVQQGTIHVEGLTRSFNAWLTEDEFDVVF